ncbi:unnamed protein product [Penicillium roqueforti FM164]|uniref:Uncharacterized protein n=1 Tax=Penicillium roqueforti (strain FM164) TaxID=1365484 RepID=W6QM58_PENRF|nr:unnamed protein product [Penicillium roqueforti FM164]
MSGLAEPHSYSLFCSSYESQGERYDLMTLARTRTFYSGGWAAMIMSVASQYELPSPGRYSGPTYFAIAISKSAKLLSTFLQLQKRTVNLISDLLTPPS